MSVDASTRRVQRALVFLEAHLFDAVTADQVAAAVGGSVSELHRLFRRVYGTSMMAYWRGRRLTEAARMLDARADLLTVAQRCGYQSQATFTRAFSRHFGVPPGQYRRSGERPLAWVEMPQLQTLQHRQGLPAHRLEWLHQPLALHGHTGSLTIDSDAGVQALAEALIVPDDVRLFGVLMSEVGPTLPYFLGCEAHAAGPVELTLMPGLYAVFSHQGPREHVRDTVYHAVQTAPFELLKPAQRPSFEVFRKGALEQPELALELWLAVERSS